MGCSTSKVASNSNTQVPKTRTSCGSAEDEYIEEVVCKDSDIGENEMKSFQMGEVGSVLVVRQNGQLSALGSKCTHYGAPLSTGSLGDGRVRCPWHGACFNIKSGDIEDFPGVDSLPCFQLEVVDNNVKVRARKSELKTSKRMALMSKQLDTDPSHIIIIGGGPSGNSCVETLRQNGFTGRITMLCKEAYLPYDRVKVSKTMDASIEQLQLRTEKFYEEHRIQVMRNTEAQRVNTTDRKVILKNGGCMPYTKLYLATGSEAARPKIPGADLNRIMTVRTFEDAQKIYAMLGEDKEVVVLGGSFIAMEAAAYIASKVKKLTLIFRDSVPFEKVFGKEIGSAVLSLFKAPNIETKPKTGIVEFIGDNSNVKSVKLTTGETLKADLVVLGTGSTLNTAFLQDSGIKLNDRGGVEVDEFLQTNIPNVYAGGDIAHAPVFANDNRKSTIGHFGLAQYHGRIAGLNLAGKMTCQRAVPFFWTMLFGKGIRYCGHTDFDEILYNGDVPNLNYAAYFLKDGVVTAVSTCMLPGAAEYANYVAQGKKLYKQDLGANYTAWMTKLVADKTSL